MTTLKLYQTHLTLGRNARVDNIESYLATLQHTDLNIQYQRLGTDIAINVPVPQKHVGEAKWNYASITQDGKIYYFFVIGANWRARNTVALTLSMDTVNTWWDELSWSSKTSIVREHQDRFIKGTNYGGLEQAGYARKIDKFSEGLEPVLTARDKDENFETWNDIGKGKNWYMVYKTRSDITPEDTINPISVLTVCDEPIELQPELNKNDITLKASEWSTGTRFITETGNDNPSITLYSPTHTHVYDFPVNQDGTKIRAYRIIQGRTTWKIYSLSYSGDSYPYSFFKEAHVIDVNKIEEGSSIKLHNIAVVQNVNENVDFYKTLTSLDTIDGLPADTYNAGHIPARSTIGFNDLDRSNSKFTKIVELPYPPCDFRVNDDGSYSPIGSWTYNVGYQAIESTLNNQEFGSKIQAKKLSDVLFHQITKPTGNEEFMPQNESKLYNSEFYKMAMVYGDVSLPIKLERIIPPTSDVNSPLIYPYFSVSNALSSTMLFKADYLHCNYRYEYDKDGCLFSTVSTEKPIFNSSYVDYLRAGYNYDKEALNQQNRMAAINGTLNAIGGLVSVGGAAYGGIRAGLQNKQRLATLDDIRRNDLNQFLVGDEKNAYSLSYAPGGTPLANWEVANKTEENMRLMNQSVASTNAWVAAKRTKVNSTIGISLATQLISSGINAVGSAISTISSIQSNNRNFAANMTAKQAQAVNALGVSDIDIQTQAVGNALRLTAYKPEPEIAEQIARTFHYMGYNHPVQEVPNFTSRYWFNFIQCEPVFRDEEVSVYSNYLDDIKARFSAGITVYHSHNGVIDWEQEKENWENWFFDTKIQVACGPLRYNTSVRRGGYSLNANRYIDNNKFKVELQLDDRAPVVISFDNNENWVALANLPTFKSARTRVVSVDKPSETSDWIELALDITL